LTVRVILHISNSHRRGKKEDSQMNYWKETKNYSLELVYFSKLIFPLLDLPYSIDIPPIEIGKNTGFIRRGMVHGLVTEGLFTKDSIMNFFSAPFAEHAMVSEHSSTAPWGTCGSNFKRLAYSFNIWNI